MPNTICGVFDYMYTGRSIRNKYVFTAAKAVVYLTPFNLFTARPVVQARSLRGRNIRREKVPQRDQFFVLLRRIVALRNEKERKNGPLWCFCSRNIFCRADS